MPMDIFLDYLINSISSLPIHLDVNVLSDLEDSWLWRHLTPGFFKDKDDNETEVDLILKWINETLPESDMLGVVDYEFNEKLATSIKSEKFFANICAFNRQHQPQLDRINISFGLEYALFSGKLGDPEDFLDIHILPCLDGVRILYGDWLILKGNNLNRTTCSSTTPHKATMPLSNVTNVTNKSQTPMKLRTTPATIVKKRKRDSSISASHVSQSSKRNPTGARIFSTKATADEDPRVFKEKQQACQLEETEIQRLMKILEDTVEHVDDSQVLPPMQHLQVWVSQTHVSSNIKSSSSNPSLLVLSTPFLSRCSSSSSATSASTTSTFSASSSRSSRSSISSLSSSSSPSISSVIGMNAASSPTSNMLSKSQGCYRSQSPQNCLAEHPDPFQA
ncbi:hypothetical protein C8R42DRAFT_439749 [Lentinula raphanica]|nr:hypothetical protein C8R42DRAFT_439749 [Lentinula raphanica]